MNEFLSEHYWLEMLEATGGQGFDPPALLANNILCLWSLHWRCLLHEWTNSCQNITDWNCSGALRTGTTVESLCTWLPTHTLQCDVILALPNIFVIWLCEQMKNLAMKSSLQNNFSHLHVYTLFCISEASDYLHSLLYLLFNCRVGHCTSAVLFCMQLIN